MFVRKTTRRYKGKTYTNYLLVESVRTPAGPRQKTVCSLGDLTPRPAAEWMRLARRVEDALAGRQDLFDSDDPEIRRIVEEVRSRQTSPSESAEKVPALSGKSADDLVAVHVDQVQVERAREAGPVHVGYEFWKRLGLSDILKTCDLSDRAIELTCAMTLNRLIHPDSEHAMPNWIRSTALDELIGVDFEGLGEDSLYENLDRLYPRRSVIESALVERERTLFNLESTVFFYDLTSTYFEGQALKNPKAKRGYSRDKRPDCKQVVIGLVVGREGFPQAHEVFEGNVQDRATLGEMLDRLKDRVGLPEGSTVVVDRGMAYDENLQQLRDRNLRYVIAARQAERNQWLDEFEELDGFEEVLREPSLTNPCQKKSSVRVKRKVLKSKQVDDKNNDQEVEENADPDDKETYVLCVSGGRIEKDRAIRAKQEQRLLADIQKLQQRIDKGRLKTELAIGKAIGRLQERYPRVARYHRLEYDKATETFRHSIDTERREKAERLDGGYVLRTNRHDLSATEAWMMYSTLTRAEAAFRAMKSPLAERPIFHQLQHRVETHIFLCVLAYHLLTAIETTLLAKDVHTSWASVRETLSTHQICTVVLPTDDGVLRIRRATKPEPQHLELYQHLNVPVEILRPIKTWSPISDNDASECSD